MINKVYKYESNDLRNKRVLLYTHTDLDRIFMLYSIKIFYKQCSVAYV